MTWPGPGTGKRWASSSCPVCGQRCKGVHAERVVDLQPEGLPVADQYYVIPDQACDELGRLIRSESVVARAGDRVPLARAVEWGLASAADTAGPEAPRSKGAGANRRKVKGGDR